MSDIFSSALSQHIYLHIIDLISAGEHALLKEAGLTPEQIKTISSLKSVEAQHLYNRRAQLFQITANTSVIDALLSDIERERLCDKCIQAGASNQFLYQFFKLDGRDAKKRRMVLGVQGYNVPRFPKNIHQSSLIEQQYLKVLGDRDFESFTAEDYYQLYLNLRDMGQEVSLKAIWQAVHQLNEDGLEGWPLKTEAGEA